MRVSSGFVRNRCSIVMLPRVDLDEIACIRHLHLGQCLGVDNLYGQHCPVARAAELDRWTVLIVRELLADIEHFNDRRGEV